MVVKVPTTIILRLPSTSSTDPQETSSSFTPPPHSFVLGNWQITHSALPMWKTKLNVRLHYTSLPNTQIDDQTTYKEPANPTKAQSFHGVDTPSSTIPGAYDWRGKGWLRIASTHWEVLGWGRTEDGDEWMLTYFTKTIFTASGMSVLARVKAGEENKIVGTSQKLLDDLKEAVGKLGDPELAGFVDALCETRQDQSAF